MTASRAPYNSPSADPLASLSPAQLARLARRASRRRRRYPAALSRLAARSGVSVRRLRLLADAWEVAGSSGIASLHPAPRAADPVAMRRVDGALEAWRRRHYPLETLRWDVWRNRVTLWHVVPGTDRRGEADWRALAHLRLTTDGRWHLFRKTPEGDWWPVPVERPGPDQHPWACLEAIRLDPDHVFWSAKPRTYEGTDHWFGPSPA